MSVHEEQLRRAAAAMARSGLVDAFGHVSVRLTTDRFLITPPRPLGAWNAAEPPVEVSLASDELPVGAPGETWIHWAIYRARRNVVSVCRGQPHAVQALMAMGRDCLPLHGHGALVGAHVPLHDDARLVRTREHGERLAATLSGASAVILRGNGAVAVGVSIASAVARLWALDASARVNLAAGDSPRTLTRGEILYWQGAGAELLERIFVALDGNRHVDCGCSGPSGAA